ncbi:hypothetical protein [Myxococcus xanthus]|nr:hypothetical protein [Myxococcus xanthus]
MTRKPEGLFEHRLTDAPDGYAVVALKDGRLRLETVSVGLPPRG